ncbi:MAG TPA: hypothetical protein VK399_08125 [Longimicrobiaceae bacterium]|nr:hypothetical protein [Longimicrobiaceae bacterium]
MLRSRRSAPLALLAMLLAAASGAALVRAPSAAHAADACGGACAEPADSVEVTYLGVGG